MVTRYVVDLETGGQLVVVRQNLERTSAEVLEDRGAAVRIAWREENTFTIGEKEKEEG